MLARREDEFPPYALPEYRDVPPPPPTLYPLRIHDPRADETSLLDILLRVHSVYLRKHAPHNVQTPSARVRVSDWELDLGP